MLKKAAAAILCIMLFGLGASAEDTSYTFSGVNVAKKCDTTEVSNVRLAEDITISTEGDMNYKTAAVTDTEHNKECGYYPINPDFTCDGSYIFMGCGNTNEHSRFVLHLPEIPAHSRVTLTYAKPVITNNGSTRRNAGDPYAYFTIGSAKLSINGGEFDEWREESVVTETAVSEIDFDCSKWGAVAISKIEIAPDDTKLCILNIKSNPYANITADGIKYYADSDGVLSIPSIEEGIIIKITAEKDGYLPNTAEMRVDKDVTEAAVPLEINGDYSYYESDFGNASGTLSMDGDFAMNGGEIKDGSYFSARLTFEENGEFKIGNALTLKYFGDGTMYEGNAFESTADGNKIKDNEKGIFATAAGVTKFITLKNNMEFSVKFDGGRIIITENGKSTEFSGSYDGGALSGHGVTADYFALSDSEPDILNIAEPVEIPETADVSDRSKYYISGAVSGTKTYTVCTIEDNESISGYRLYTEDGKSAEIKKTTVPAAAVPGDGIVFAGTFSKDGELKSLTMRRVKPGDKTEVSEGTRYVYFSSGTEIKKLTEADTTAEGFELAADLAAGTKFEISPVYTFENVGDVKDSKTLASVANGLYDITFKKAQTQRGDIYVNGFMAGNNVDQADADRHVTEGALYTAEDVRVRSGEISVSMTDGSTELDYVTVQKKPDFYQRPKRIYVIGDSLACEYYGSFDREVGGGRSGWGQQLGNFVKLPITNLANSGQYASGLYATAFPSILANGYEGDIALIECAYNDRNYSTREEMTACLYSMAEQCKAYGITPIFVTPNASKHDYKPSVAWSGYMRDTAYDTDTALIDLSNESYTFLHSLYGDDEDNTVTMNYNLTAVGGDTLHSSYAGAMKWASVIAEKLGKLGYSDIVNYDYEYTFTDTLGNVIKAKAADN